MAKTFNRPPLSVSTPSSSDVKQYFFNHYNWKGLNDDKNFLATDQETFGDCNNVYVDSEGLLKSRPAQKIKVVKVTVNGEEAVLANIVNTWVFEYVTVYQSEHNGQSYLTFVNSNTNVNAQALLQDAAIKLIVADEKIFVFSETSLSYYDMRTNDYGTAENFIHIPVVKVITDGIVDAAADVESPNLLTNSYITKYLYTSTENIDFDNFVGKDVTVEVDGVTYPIPNFVYNNQLVFVGRYTGLSRYNFVDDKIFGEQAAGLPLVQVGENGSMIVCSYSYTIDENTKIPTISWTIYHTSDGITFNRVPDIDGVLGMPKISRDGIYCIVFKQNGPYIYSLLEGESGKVYPTWVNLLEKINPEQYRALNLNLNQVQEKQAVFNQTIVVNGYFCDNSVFAFTYGEEPWSSPSDNFPCYNDFYCIYCDGSGNIYKREIFYSTAYLLSKISTPQSITSSSNILFNSIKDNDNVIGYESNNINNLNTWEFVSDTITADDVQGSTTATITDIVYTKIKAENFSDEHPVFSVSLTAKLKLSGITEKTVSFTKDEYRPYIRNNDGEIKTYNSWVSDDGLFKYTIESRKDLLSDYVEYLTIEPSDFARIVFAGLPIQVGQIPDDYTFDFVQTCGFMPNVYVKKESSRIQIFVDYISQSQNSNKLYRNIDVIETSTTETIDSITYTNKSDCRSPIRDASVVSNGRYITARINKNNAEQDTVITTFVFPDVGRAMKTQVTVLTEPLAENFYDQSLVLSDPSGYLVTGKYLFDYNDYTDTTTKYKPIELLFPVKPVAYYYQGNSSDNLYLATSNVLYTNTGNKVIAVSEVTKGNNNYFLPSFYTQLSNYYLSKGNELYISAPSFSLEIDSSGKLRREKSEFKWYFPKIAKQTFDYNITNLHVISDTDVAIFFEHSVTLVRWDSEASAYVYYNSKLQAGCKMGCDVLTTYDGKYVIFTSGRGLVAMTYQEFMATTEQTLQYLSDTIYSVYNKYITEPTSTNHIKLFKYGYWILIYKPDSNKGFIFDIRNNSWWPITSLHNVKKLIQRNEKIELLSNGSMYDLSTLETDYFDNDGKKHKIPWFLKSQKLYLNAPNYYKHIINLTFMSVHDKQLLQNSNYNVDELNFILQANNYRKRINGNIGSEDDYTSVSYNVESIRTYVQRLNYSKVNEFEYLLSSDDESAIDIPLSLSSITIKYKIGSQVR